MILYLKKKIFKTQDISNMTIKRIFILLIIFVPLNVMSQSKELKKADDYFSKFDYQKALAAYEKLEKAGESRYHVIRRIADCFRLQNMPVMAIEWYEKAIKYSDVEAETYYHLGLTLRILKRYDESERYIARFHTLTRTQGLQRGLSLEEYLNYIKSDSTNAEVHNLEFNTQYSEFGPALWNNHLIFSSNRPSNNMIEYKDARNNQSFFNLYSILLNDIQNDKQAVPFQLQIKSKFNDGPICFSSDENTMYITRNTATDQSGKSELDIVLTRSRDGKWDKTVSNLPLKYKGYSIAHPSITNDGERLYFVSDMPGGYGGMDIYYSERRGGFFSQPINLGPNVNTPGNELFPHITPDGHLFFASNGHSGLGGLDIFVSLPMETGFSEPFNLGPGINSSYDDFSIVFNKDGESGFFASNRPEGKGEDDIYSFKILKPLKFTLISGSIKNKQTGETEPGVDIIVTRRDRTQIALFQSNSDGNFHIHLYSDEQYKFAFRKRLMTPVEKQVTPTQLNNSPKLNMNIEMEMR